MSEERKQQPAPIPARRFIPQIVARGAYSGKDHSTDHGSVMLALKIEKYWADRGYPNVKCTRFTTPDYDATRRHSFWHVRSNLDHRGLPPKEAK